VKAKIYAAYICLDLREASTTRQKFLSLGLEMVLDSTTLYATVFQPMKGPTRTQIAPPWVVDELSLHKPIKACPKRSRYRGSLDPVDKPPVSYNSLSMFKAEILRRLVLVSSLLNDPR
jgi:hypothetical protein